MLNVMQASIKFFILFLATDMKYVIMIVLLVINKGMIDSFIHILKNVFTITL